MNVILTGSSGAYWLNMCLFYFTVAAFTAYYLLTFWRLAPGTGHPALWAPFGRMLDSGMVLLTGAIHLSSFPTPVVLALDIAGVALVILCMAVGGDFNLMASQPYGSEGPPESTAPGGGMENENTPSEAASLLSPQVALARMQEKYQLTPREKDVLRELVLTEDKQDQLHLEEEVIQASVRHE